MEKRKKDEYSWFLKKENDDGSEWWVVENSQTMRRVDCSSEAACEKIVSLAESIKTNSLKPLNHRTLEKKANWLQKKTKHIRAY